MPYPVRTTKVSLPKGRHAPPMRGETKPEASNSPPGMPAFDAGTHRPVVAAARKGATGWDVRSTWPLLFSPATAFPILVSKVAPAPRTSALLHQ